MTGTTWTKFFWADWMSDPALRLCSYAARGLWMDMLSIAASHDPVGYVAVAGRALDSTSLARMTGGTESEVAHLLSDLDRNGVFSRDRHGAIYSRRMVKDAKLAAQARQNGQLGGNPSLRNNERNPPPDNPQVNGGVGMGVKPHKPYARRRVKPPNGLTPSSARDAPLSPNEGEAARAVWPGPADIREAFVAKMHEPFVRSYLDPCKWQDVPERMILSPTGMGADALWKSMKTYLLDHEISIGRTHERAA